ncbi:MAG: Maf family protein [Candidatus Kerfeldbacteria bacterium]|nr:Maf family protein [Candidatus Kerfeldbacteria bacterium]
MNRKIILASQSQARKKIFSLLNIPFAVVPAHIDEQAIRHDDPGMQAELIARAKAEAVAKEHPNAIIIAADTFTVCDGIILEKPHDTKEAAQMLRLQSGKPGMAYSGFCYIDAVNKIQYSTTVETAFTFRELQEEEIAVYVRKFPVTTWSAAYSPATAYTLTMIASMNGSATSFTHGLPMEVLISLLQKSGFSAHP